jgi:trehalose/maltose hydrolase-like predicted phosphorylase
VVHAVISSYLAAEETAWSWFMEAMASDIYDTQGGTTPEGIHCGVMAGTLDVITRYFAGIDFSTGTPEINPHLPPHWKKLSMKVCHRRRWYDMIFSPGKLELTVTGKLKTAQALKIREKTVKLTAGKSRVIKL